jgi:hypothetical protein
MEPVAGSSENYLNPQESSAPISIFPRLLLGIVLICAVGVSLFFYNSREGLSLRVLASDRQYSLLIQHATLDPQTQAYMGALVLKNNQTRKEYALEDNYTDDSGAIILYVSDSGAYAQLSVGTSVSRGIEIYSLEGVPKLVSSFCAQHQALIWKEKYAIYLDCENGNAPRPWEGGAPNLAAANLITGATSTLVASSPLSTYGTPSIQGDKLTYITSSVSKESDWMTKGGAYVNNDPPIMTSTTAIDIPTVLKAVGLY